jgi:transcriptional regulator with XRE-family HTH domain
MTYTKISFFRIINMSQSTLIKFGNRVRKERLKRNLSQEDLAARVGVHRTYIGMIERAEKNITLKNIEKIASALKIKIYELFKEL